MSAEVFVVLGESDGWDDRAVWAVAAFSSREAAEERAAKANSVVDGVKHEPYTPTPPNPHDALMPATWDAFHIFYYVEAVELDGQP